MPKLLQVSNFANGGINSDLMPWDLPPEFLTDVRNIRIGMKSLMPLGGQVHWSTLPVDFDPGLIMHVGAVSGQYWLIAGDDGIYAFDSAVYSDVSRPDYAGVVDKDLWSGCMISRIPVLNNPTDYPQYWAPQTSGTMMTLLPWDDTQTWEQASQRCDTIRSHKQFLFALGVLDSITKEYVADGVRWSSPADVNLVPDSWNEQDVTNVAGYTTLGGPGGNIIDGLSMRDAFVVYRERSIHVFDYVGGQYIWQIRHQSSTIGLLSKDCLVEVKGDHYFMAENDIMVNDGNSITSIMHDRLRKRYNLDLNKDEFKNCFAVENYAFAEIWFCLPTNGSTYPNEAFIYNWRDLTWTIRDLPDTIHASYGPQIDEAGDTWDTVQGDWESIGGVWNSGGRSVLNSTIVAITGTELVLPDRSNEIGNDLYDCFFERLGYALGGVSRVTTITRVYPRMTGPGSVMVQVGSMDYPGSPVRWKPAVAFSPDLDRKVDIRTTGELHCFRISSDDTNSTWRISGIDIEYEEAGAR